MNLGLACRVCLCLLQKVYLKAGFYFFIFLVESFGDRSFNSLLSKLVPFQSLEKENGENALSEYKPFSAQSLLYCLAWHNSYKISVSGKFRLHRVCASRKRDRNGLTSSPEHIIELIWKLGMGNSLNLVYLSFSFFQC